MTQHEPQEMLLHWSIASEPGNERQAVVQVADAVAPLHLPDRQLANLKTAVAEAVMNAMEHGNTYQTNKLVVLQLLASDHALTVRILDQGKGEVFPAPAMIALPDLPAKLSGQQTPRGWGLFLIKSLVDELHIYRKDEHQIVELVLVRQSRLPSLCGEQQPDTQIKLKG